MLLELKDIHKNFGKIKANNGINLTIRPGIIHGILGENGAGKSTLMKILSGFIRKTRGTIMVQGKRVNYSTPSHASQFGVGMLYQDPLDFPNLTVLNNFMLGLTNGIKNKSNEFRKDFEKLSKNFGFALSPNTPVNQLTIGERQQLEILRLLYSGVKMLILDEPTTGISGLQKKILFNALNILVSQGKSVILVSHKLEDVEALCDKITVLHRGEVSGEMEKPFNTRQILKMMFGTLPEAGTHSGTAPGKPILEMYEITASGGRTGLKECSATTREGQVLGLAGLEGSGQGVFLRVAAGLTKASKGTISISGKQMRGKNHLEYKLAGVAFLPGSRIEEGLMPELTIIEHFVIQNQEKKFFIDWKEAVKKAKTAIKDFSIKGEPESAVESLSGGNQQRLLLSFLPRNPFLLLLENPTRGLDVESANRIWKYIHEYSARNKSVIFSSSELDEILLSADRVKVFFDGKITKNVITTKTDINELGSAIAGKGQV
jgi:general nucleoside transport system ATP-binding protein